jgi:hypothetical protein
MYKPCCRMLRSFGLAGAFSLCLLPCVQGATFSVNPVADAFVTTGPGGNLTGNNYGSAGSLSIAAPGLAQGEFQSVIRFNLSGAVNLFDTQFGAGQWSLQSISLQLGSARPNNPIFNGTSPGLFNIGWMQNDTWDEGTGGPATPSTSGITFSSLQSTFIAGADENLGAFAFNGSTNGLSTYNLAFAPGFTADLLAGDDVSLRLFAADASVSYLFNSRSFGNVASRPLLTVVAVPEPAPLALGVIGLLVLCGWRLTRAPQAKLR